MNDDEQFIPESLKPVVKIYRRGHPKPRPTTMIFKPTQILPMSKLPKEATMQTNTKHQPAFKPKVLIQSPAKPKPAPPSNPPTKPAKPKSGRD
jgi:hypothetical protein